MNDTVSARVVESARVVQILNEEPYCRIGEVELRGALRKINLSFVPEARPGERVVVRGGVALRVLGENEGARDTRSPELV